MNQEKLQKLKSAIREERNDFLNTVSELERRNILKLSDTQFSDLNRQLYSLSLPKRRKVINELIAKAISIKLISNGYRSEEVAFICKHISDNWQLIIEKQRDVTIRKLIDNAKLCWQKKEDQLSIDIEQNKLSPLEFKKRLSGISRLSTVSGIIALDSIMLFHNPADKIFYSSFWAAAVIFHQGIDQIFNL